MIQDIDPRQFNNSFASKNAELQDLFLAFNGDTILVKEDQEKLWYPSFSDFQEKYPRLRDNAKYLFSIDDFNYFLVEEKALDAVEGWRYASINTFRTETKYWRSFAGVVGWQLNRWYANHRYCSRCGKPTTHSNKERMLYCEDCGFQTYPTISPCVIVGGT